METFQQTLTNMSQRSHSDPLKIIQGYHLFPESFVSVRFVFLRHYLRRSHTAYLPSPHNSTRGQ